MKTTLLKGSFAPKDLEKLLTQFFQIKIKYHEDKIQSSDDEETMKMRETRIIKLQNDLKELRNFLKSSDALINADTEIILTKSNH